MIANLGAPGTLLEAGGPVVWVIAAVSLSLWTLIIERYLYMLIAHPAYLEERLAVWCARDERDSWYAHQVRVALEDQIGRALERSLGVIRTLIAICPLLGVLGTVTGMMVVFDTIAVLGSGDPRVLASGVARATTPTMAGMVVALSGLLFSTHLEQRVRRIRRRVAERFERPER